MSVFKLPYISDKMIMMMAMIMMMMMMTMM